MSQQRQNRIRDHTYIERSLALLRVTSAIAAGILIATLLASCASSRRAIRNTEGDPIPHFIELQEERSIATVHFPRGLYSLDSTDETGYYYRPLHGLTKRTFVGSVPQEGGIFIRKSDRTKVRGYVIWAGGLTKIGNLSNARYVLRD